MDESKDDGAARRPGRKDRQHVEAEPTSPVEQSVTRRQRGPKPRHFLEDEDDREIAKYFGSGRSRARCEERGAARLRAAVQRHVLVVLHGGADRVPSDDDGWSRAIADLRLVATDVGPRGGSVRITLACRHEDSRSRAALAERLAVLLRAELAAHVPRRRTPEVRVRLVVDDADGRSGEEGSR